MDFSQKETSHADLWKSPSLSLKYKHGGPTSSWEYGILLPDQFGRSSLFLWEYRGNCFINWQAVEHSNNCLAKTGNTQTQRYKKTLLGIRPQYIQTVILPVVKVSSVRRCNDLQIIRKRSFVWDSTEIRYTFRKWSKLKMNTICRKCPARDSNIIITNNRWPAASFTDME